MDPGRRRESAGKGNRVAEGRGQDGSWPDTGAIEPCAALCKTLGVASRLELLASIVLGPASVGTLADRHGLECSLISHHLRPLRDAGLVVSAQDGHRRVYSAGPSVVEHHVTGSALRLSLRDAAGGVQTVCVPVRSMRASPGACAPGQPAARVLTNGELREPKPSRAQSLPIKPSPIKPPQAKPPQTTPPRAEPPQITPDPATTPPRTV